MSWLRENAGVVWPAVLTMVFAVAAMCNDIFALAAVNPAAFATFGAAAGCFGFLVGKIAAEQSKEAAAERTRDKDRAAAVERERRDRESAERIAAKQAEEETKREQIRADLEREGEERRRQAERETLDAQRDQALARLSYAQMEALIELYDDEVSNNTICTEFRTTDPSIDQLVKMRYVDYIDRVPGSTSSRFILTPEGREFLGQVHSQMRVILANAD